MFSSRFLLRIIVIASLVGLIISGYSFLHNRSIVSGTFCNINSEFSCDVVNRGPYSVIAGIPVALIGVVGYAFIFFGAIAKIIHPHDRGLSTFLASASIAGFAFSLYLTGIEAFVLDTWCVLCLTSQAGIFVATIASCQLWYRERIA